MDKTDYKKQDKLFYSPKITPSIVKIPKMNFVAVRGVGNPNDETGEYSQAMKLLYGISYSIKMSKKSGDSPKGYFDFVVPPIEGLWDIEISEITQNGINDKSKFNWISMIRLPDFVDEDIFSFFKNKLQIKKPELDLTKAFYFSLEEGLCAQIMHIGAYNDEKPTIDLLSKTINELGYSEDFDMKKYRYHHEIYLGDPRRTSSEKLKTIIRHPIKLKES